MKLVIKYEWKWYLLLTILLGLFMAGIQIRDTKYIVQWMNEDDSEGILPLLDEELELFYKEQAAGTGNQGEEDYYGWIGSLPQRFRDVNGVKNITQGILSSMSYGLLEKNIIYVLALLAFLKCIQYRNEWNSQGREFLYFMPVKRLGRKAGYILLNIALIAGSCFICMLALLMYAYALLKNMEVNVPWLAPAAFGASVTGISYLFMLLAVTEFLEALFVEGSMKFFGVGGIWVMGIVSAEHAFLMLYRAAPIRNIFGFLSLSAAGKQYYSFGDMANPASMDFWTHSPAPMDIIYKGQPFGNVYVKELAAAGINENEAVEFFKMNSMHGSAARLYGFRTAADCILYMLGYLAIAALFTALALWLSQKQDLSKKCFHFAFGRYLVALMVGITFFTTIMYNAVALWHEVIAGIASICIFLGCSYILNPYRHEEKEIQLKDSLVP